ncbi:MAG: hypothetical protein KBA95_12635, partial [Acidobacteria bacterium]|nr:hypothetical protein [Acidobacteriota bacterium]
DAAQKLWALGVPLEQVNDRLDLGLETDKIPGADVGFFSFNVVPVDFAMEPPEPAPPPGADEDEGEPPTQGKRVSLAGTSEKRRALVWRSISQRTRDLEQRFEAAMRSYLRALESEVLEAVGGLKGWQLQHDSGAVDKAYGLFDARKANAKLRRVAEPAYKQAIKRGGESVIAEAGLEISFQVDAPGVVALLAKLQRKIVGINDRLEQALRDHLGEVLATPGGTSVDDLRDAVREVFDASLGRARTIARTEMGAAFSGARIEGMKQGGIERHEWLSARDQDVRESHQIDGEAVDIGESFSNGLTQPNDPDGAPEEVINCRCVTVPVVET